MSIYVRKLAEQAIRESKSVQVIPDADALESIVLGILDDIDTPDKVTETIGRMIVVCADLLELVRRTDLPAYRASREAKTLDRKQEQ